MPSFAVAAFDLAAAVKAAGNGGAIWVPEGTHAVGGLAIPAGVSLVGAGPGKTVLDAATSGDAIVIEG